MNKTLQPTLQVYTIPLIALIITVILVLVYLFLKWLESYKKSPQYIESHKNAATTLRIVNRISKDANFTKEEKEFLVNMCNQLSSLNIEYIIRDTEKTDELFKKKYQQLCENDIPGSVNQENEKLKALLFSIRYKIEVLYKSTFVITSSKSIVPGQKMQYTDIRGTLWTIELVENTNQGLKFELPAALASSNLKPEPTSKVNVTFTTKSNICYAATFRIARYEKNDEGKEKTMITIHTNNLKAMKRRMSKRMVVNNNCVFSAVEVKGNPQAGRKNLEYIPMEKTYNGILQDISSNGCRIISSLPIKQGQYMHIKFQLNDFNAEATGLIVMTTQTEDKQHYILHVQFVKIEEVYKNKIYATIYEYLEQNQQAGEL